MLKSLLGDFEIEWSEVVVDGVSIGELLVSEVSAEAFGSGRVLQDGAVRLLNTSAGEVPEVKCFSIQVAFFGGA